MRNFAVTGTARFSCSVPTADRKNIEVGIEELTESLYELPVVLQESAVVASFCDALWTTTVEDDLNQLKFS